MDTVIGDGGTEFDLHELGRCILVFKRGVTDAVAAGNWLSCPAQTPCRLGLRPTSRW